MLRLLLTLLLFCSTLPLYSVGYSRPKIVAASKLRAAAKRGDCKSMRALLEKFSMCRDLTCKLGRNALYYAATNGHKDAVELLLKEGADPTTVLKRDGTVPVEISQHRAVRERLDNAIFYWRQAQDFVLKYHQYFSNKDDLISFIRFFRYHSKLMRSRYDNADENLAPCLRVSGYILFHTNAPQFIIMRALKSLVEKVLNTYDIYAISRKERINLKHFIGYNLAGTLRLQLQGMLKKNKFVCS